jgi:hypothetical protein
MKTYLHLLHSVQLVLEWKMFLTKVVTNKTTHILGSFFFLNHGKIVYSRTSNRRQYSTAHAIFIRIVNVRMHIIFRNIIYRNNII